MCAAFSLLAGCAPFNHVAPEAALADHVIHAELAFAASPLPSCFRYARSAGERRAREELPMLQARLARAGILTGTAATSPPP